MTTSAMNRITVREGERPLLVMDGTGDDAHLWLFDPNQITFFCYERDKKAVPIPTTTAFRRNDKAWIFISIEPTGKWEPVASLEAVNLLNGMEEAVFAWVKEKTSSTATTSSETTIPISGDKINATLVVDYVSIKEGVIYVRNRPSYPILLGDVEPLPNQLGCWKTNK